MFLEFFKTGLFAVGGGLATIPFLREIGVRYGWYTMSDLSTMIAVSESTPGPMGVNMASYVGFSQYGVLGSIVVTLGLVLPSLIIICIIANFLEKFKEDDLFDPFILLNINPEDSIEFIKKQYRKSASLCHPDHNNDSVEARNIFVLINKSYKMVQNIELCDVYTQYKTAISNGLEYKAKILRYKLKSLVDEMIKQ